MTLRGPKPKDRDLHPLVYKFRELRRDRNISATMLGDSRYIHGMETEGKSPGLFRFVELLNALGFDLVIVEKPNAHPSPRRTNNQSHPQHLLQGPCSTACNEPD